MALVLSAEQMKAADQAAIEKLGLPSLVLMENAGRGVSDVIRREMARTDGLDVRVVCGAGQNGGDGFVVARHLANAGAKVRVFLAVSRAKIAGDAAVYARVLDGLSGVVIADGSQVVDEACWTQWLAEADVVVDAIFGTGLRADVTLAPAAAIAAMNATPALRVAVDLPSGLDADSGAVRGVAVAADITVTMGCRKLGLVLDPEVRVGRVEVVDLGVPESVLAEAARLVGPLCHWIDTADLARLVPRPAAGAHKGSRGHVLVVAGSAGKTGAAVLSARGAHRGGAGLVTVASTGAGQIALDAKVVETMTARYADGDDADEGSHARLMELSAGMKAVAVGPGVPTGPGMRALVAALVAELPLPLVVDADALNLMGPDVARLAGVAPAARILTPHPGEMARLAGVPAAEVQRDRLGHARRLAAATKAVVVLKGARTIVAAPDGTAHVNPAANPALSTAGSGDVLTGVVAALCAQGVEAIDAARLGVHVHGLAAEAAAGALGGANLVAGDIADALPRAFEQVAAFAGRMRA